MNQTKEIDPHGKDPHKPGAKLDNGKVLPWLCISGFSRALEEVAMVTTMGALKYTRNGWMEVPNGAERYMEAFGRHMLALGRGEVFDNGPGGTNCMHKAQAIWNLMASLELELRQANQQHVTQQAEHALQTAKNYSPKFADSDF